MRLSYVVGKEAPLAFWGLEAGMLLNTRSLGWPQHGFILPDISDAKLWKSAPRCWAL